MSDDKKMDISNSPLECYLPGLARKFLTFWTFVTNIKTAIWASTKTLSVGVYLCINSVQFIVSKLYSFDVHADKSINDHSIKLKILNPIINIQFN